MVAVALWVIVVILVAVLEIILKGMATWIAAKNGQKTWFWVLLVLNTAGILPIVYMTLVSKKSEKKTVRRKSR
jgi:hypothetical protein